MYSTQTIFNVVVVVGDDRGACGTVTPRANPAPPIIVPPTVTRHGDSGIIKERRDMKLDKKEIAQVMHRINKAYCESIGDYSQPDWESAPAHQKSSCIDAVNYHMERDATPEESHINWMNHKLNEGWCYGPIKNEEKKEHPCIVPFSSLSPEQQSKDHLAKAVVKILMDI